MKKDDNILTYKLRELLRNKSVRNLVLEIFEEYKNEKEKTFICISAFDSCVEDVNAKYRDSLGVYEIDYKNCYKIPELTFIFYLIDNKIINASTGGGDDSDMVLSIKNINKEKFQIILNWVKNTQYIISFGLFSLNTFTGAAYCRDNHNNFEPGKGYYNLLKKFIKRNKKHISFQEIYDTQQCTTKDELKKLKPEIAKFESIERVKYLKKRLKIGKLLRMYEKKGFIMLPDLFPL